MQRQGFPWASHNRFTGKKRSRPAARAASDAFATNPFSVLMRKPAPPPSPMEEEEVVVAAAPRAPGKQPPGNGPDGKRKKRSKRKATAPERKGGKGSPARTGAAPPGRARSAAAGNKGSSPSADEGEERSLSNAWLPDRSFASDDGELLLAGIRPGEQLPFVGSVRMACVSGVVECHGFTVRAGEHVVMHSPRWQGFQTVTCSSESPAQPEEPRASAGAALVPAGALQKAHEGLRRRCAATVLFSRAPPADSLASAAEDASYEASLVAKQGDERAARPQVPGMLAMTAARCGAALEQSPALAPDRVRDVASLLLQQSLAEGSEMPVALVCGAKATGKSTTARYLVNRLISGFGKAALLDLDPGQPEVGLPGTISCVLLDAPLLAPAHASTARWASCGAGERCGAFIGSSTPKADPVLYTSAVRGLALRAASMLRGVGGAPSDGAPPFRGASVPVVINCFGWVKGLGADLLQVIAQLTGPTHVLKLVGTSNARSFDLSAVSCTAPGAAAPEIFEARAWTTPAAAVGRAGTAFDRRLAKLAAYLRGAGGEAPPLLQRYALSHRLATAVLARQDVFGAVPFVRARAKALSNAAGGGAAAATVRAGGLHDPLGTLGAELMARGARVASLGDVTFGFTCGGDVSDAEAVTALSGTLVGVCAAGEAPAAALAESRASVGGVPLRICRDAEALARLDCVGLAVVRAFDMARGEVAVVTPAPLPERAVLVRGALSLPAELLSSTLIGPSPYLSFEAVGGAVAGVMKSRNNIERRAQK